MSEAGEAVAARSVRRPLWSLPGRALRRAFRRAFRNRHSVWVCDAEPRAIEPDVPLAIERFEREQDLPGSLRAELRAYAGAEYEEVLRAEFARRGTLWIGLVQGRVAAFQWSRRASSIPVWFVPLRPADVVLLGTETLPELRGRGIAPAMLAHIVRRERSGEGRVLVDCKVWNRPAMRAFERAGFRRLAECAPPGWERAA